MPSSSLSGPPPLGESLIAALEGVQDPVVFASLEGSVQLANRAFWSWFRSGELQPGDALDLDRILAHAEGAEGLRRSLWDALRDGRAWTGRVRLTLPDGSRRTVRLRATPVHGAGGVQFLVLHLYDLSEEIAQAEAEASREQFDLLLDLLGTSLGELESPLAALRLAAAWEDTDLARVPEDLRPGLERVRRAAWRLTGLFRNLQDSAAGASREEEGAEPLLQVLVLGAPPREGVRLLEALRAQGLRILHRSARSEEEVLRAVRTSEVDAVLLGPETPPELPRRLVRSLNELRPGLPVFDVRKVDRAALARGLRRTVADFRRAQGARAAWRRMEDLALRDSLTGVLNRRALERAGEMECARSLRYGSPLALALFDLDWFKQINDSLGHLQGDRLLRTFAACLQGGARETDLVGRLGGDEFVVLMPQTDGAGGLSVAERLRRHAAEVLAAEAAEAPVVPGVSTGLAVLPAAGIHSFEDLLSRADAALYRAKAAGRGRVDRDLAGGA